MPVRKATPLPVHGGRAPRGRPGNERQQCRDCQRLAEDEQIGPVNPAQIAEEPVECGDNNDAHAAEGQDGIAPVV